MRQPRGQDGGRELRPADGGYQVKYRGCNESTIVIGNWRTADSRPRTSGGQATTVNLDRHPSLNTLELEKKNGIQAIAKTHRGGIGGLRSGSRSVF
jgi:hypothetical protein